MQLSSNFYPTPAHQQLIFPEINYTNNKDRGQRVTKKNTSSSEEEEEETQKNNNNKWQESEAQRETFSNHPKRHRDKQSIRLSNSTTRNLKQQNPHNSKNTQTTLYIEYKISHQKSSNQHRQNKL
jgi:hypothetical protein